MLIADPLDHFETGCVASTEPPASVLDASAALSTYLGHATITITLDHYGHLMPGSQVEARAMLDAYLDESET